MLQPTVLLTGFEPFNGSLLNPSAEVVRTLAVQDVPGMDLHTCVLPVISKSAPVILRGHLDAVRPNFVIALGEASGRSAVSIEQIGVNELDFKVPDNSGVMIVEQPIIEGGPATYKSTLPTETMRDAIRQHGTPSMLSNNAGRFICNQILYIGLHWAAVCSPNTRVGLIHLPSLPQQMIDVEDPTPTMALPLEVEAIRAALISVVQLEFA